MRVRFYDMNEARARRGDSPSDFDYVVEEELRATYDHLRDGSTVIAWFMEGHAYNGEEDGWVIEGQPRLIFSDFVVIDDNDGRTRR